MDGCIHLNDRENKNRYHVTPSLTAILHTCIKNTGTKDRCGNDGRHLWLPILLVMQLVTNWQPGPGCSKAG